MQKSGQLDPNVDDPCGASTWARLEKEGGDQSRRMDMQGSVDNV